MDNINMVTEEIHDTNTVSILLKEKDILTQMEEGFNNPDQTKSLGMFDDLIGTCDYGKLEWPFTCIADETPLVIDFQYYQNGDSLRVNSSYCENNLIGFASNPQIDIIQAFPNPCNNYLYLKTKDKNINLYDNLGQLVNLDFIEHINQSYIINTADLKTGIYFLVNNSGKNQKIIVQH